MPKYKAVTDSYGFLKMYWKKGQISSETNEVPPVSKFFGPLFVEAHAGDPVDAPDPTIGMPDTQWGSRGKPVPSYAGMQPVYPPAVDSKDEIPSYPRASAKATGKRK